MLNIAQHVERVDIHFLTGRLGSLLGRLDDLLRSRFGLAHDLLVAQHLVGLLTRLLDDLLRLHLGRLRNLLAFAQHAPRLPDFLRDPNAHFVDDLKHGALVHHDAAHHRHALCGRDEGLKTFNQIDEIDGKLPPRRRIAVLRGHGRGNV